jgi:hypothetical protein
MPTSTPDAPGDDMSRWQRITGTASNLFLKPAVAAEAATGDDRPKAYEPTTVPELEEAVKRSNDKERLVGLLVAPVAAAIGFIVTASLVANDPKALLANGQVNPHHVNPTLYTELGLLSMALALIMLGTAWFRKRTFFGFAAAMYGLSLFNLHYWGFGVPYILIGSWYLVRAYRLSQKLKLARAGDSPVRGPAPTPAPPNKRYTPPAAPTRRAPKPKPGNGIEAG